MHLGVFSLGIIFYLMYHEKMREKSKLENTLTLSSQCLKGYFGIVNSETNTNKPV